MGCNEIGEKLLAERTNIMMAFSCMTSSMMKSEQNISYTGISMMISGECWFSILPKQGNQMMGSTERAF